MAAFPVFDIHPKSLPSQDAGIRTRVSDGGDIHGRRAFAKPVFRWAVVYAMLSPADRATLDAFYLTNRDNLNSISIDGITYDVRFTNKPMPVEYHGLNRTMAVDLIGHEQ